MLVTVLMEVYSRQGSGDMGAFCFFFSGSALAIFPDTRSSVFMAKQKPSLFLTVVP